MKVIPFFANYGYHPHFLPNLGPRNEETLEVLEYVIALQNLHQNLRAGMIEV